MLKGAHLRIFPASNEESLEIIAKSQRGKPVQKLQHDAASAEQSLELVRPYRGPIPLKYTREMNCFCISNFRMYNAIHTQRVSTTNLCAGVTSTVDFQNYTSRIFSSGKKSKISLHILTQILAIDNIVWIDKLLHVQVRKHSEKKKSPKSRNKESNRTEQFFKKFKPKINAGYWAETDGPAHPCWTSLVHEP
jgi:hypothetical protein